jgi:tRNA nucleotidyltransferase/poly(A) polymerase
MRMTQEEQLAKQLRKEPALNFLNDFLTDNPEAKCFLVGGAVRDTLLGRRMRELDFDFVICGMESEPLERWLGEHGTVDFVGRDFGVFKFMPHGFTYEQIEYIDIALPRTEAPHKQSVGGYREFTIQSDPFLSIEEDLKRRDFTINAMAFDIRTETLIDPFGGIKDLEQRKIKTVGESKERFNEDLSRVLRAIRFASELHFDIEYETLETIRQKAPEINLTRTINEKTEFVVPRETIGVELSKALNRAPVSGIEWLRRAYLMQVLFPDIQRLIDVDPTYLLPLAQLKEQHIIIAVILLLRGLPPESIEETLTFTGLQSLPKHSSRRVDVETVQWVIKKLHPLLTISDIEHMPGAEFEKWFFNKKGETLLEVMTYIGHADIGTAVRDRRRSIEARWLIEPGEKIPLLLSGDDVLALGVPQGPKIRKLLDDGRSKQLEGELLSREEALGWLKKNVTIQ